MKRKLVKQGTATMMISLPAKWIKKNELEKGDEIDIEQKGNKLIIRLDTKQRKKETEINLTSIAESSIRTILTNAYRLGYTKIILNFKDTKSLQIIKKIIKNNLIGFEIIKKSNTSCEIENITEPSKDQFDNIFSKIFLNIDELFESAEQMLKGTKADFEETEQKIKQFDNFCRRVISISDSEDSKLIWVFHTKLSHAQREIYLLLKYLEQTKIYLKKSKAKSNKQSLELLEQCKEIFNLLKQAYKEKSIPLLEKIHDLEKQITYEKGYAELKKSKNSIIDHRILNAVRNFYLASSPLIGTFI